MAPSIALLDGPETAQLAAPLGAVFRAVFAEPPWSESPSDLDRFQDRWLADYVARPGFVCAVATDEDGSMLGFALGFTGGISAELRRATATAWGDAGAEAWFEDCFQVVEPAVLPMARGQGIGRRAPRRDGSRPAGIDRDPPYRPIRRPGARAVSLARLGDHTRSILEPDQCLGNGRARAACC